ncbi:hypothetical protein JXC34_02700 [Candidatus Woesearchaeota archaeon]|nr:hypothetical protein [Candidatus Woesearchaeota archaeon]
MRLSHFLLVIFLILCSYTPISQVKEAPSQIDIYFCPHDMCLEHMLSLIDNSTEIKCAFYDLDIPELIEELRKKNADVVIEDSNALEYFHTGYSAALMHNKFCVFDNEIILSGSMNPTDRGNYYNNNNIVILRSKYLAENFLAEFDELKNNIYGKGDKARNPVVNVGDITIENYFCPEDNCKLQVINELKAANKSVYFMTFSFTDEDIGNLLWNKNYLGLDVKGILEEKQISQYSRYEDLKEFSIIDKNKYTMHHKVFIIDNETVITGSYNPTKNANEKNDENIIIIHDKEIALKFVEEFSRLFNFQDNIPEKTSELVMSRILYDAEGSDTDKEYVEVKNIGDKEINLDYYFLTDNKTNSRLSGKVYVNETVVIKPSFSLKNSNGMLILKHNHDIIDFVAWEGLWGLEAEAGEELVRADNENIAEASWSIAKV